MSSLDSDLMLGIMLILITSFIILALIVYSLRRIQLNSRKKTYIITPSVSRDEIIRAPELSRDMTLIQAVMVGVGAMIGAGIFVLTGIAAGIAGPALLVAFIFNGLLAVLIAMVYAELGSAMPEAGGGYTFVKKGLGHSAGFFSGWMSWFAITVAGSLYSLGFAAYFLTFIDSLGIHINESHIPILSRIVALISILLFLIINQLGSSVMGRAEVWISTTKVLILVGFIAAGLVVLFAKSDPTSSIVPFFPKGFSAIFIAMGFTFIAFEGYEVIVQTGEEIYDPKSNIPKAVMLSILIVIPIYIFVGLVALASIEAPAGISTWEFLAEHEELGLLEVANKMIPILGFAIIIFGGLLSTTSALNAAIFSSTRVGFALGRDRLLPQKLGHVSKKTRTPTVSIWMTGLIMCLMAAFIPIEAVAAAADIMFLLLFFFVCIAAIRIRKKYKKLDYGFKTPLFPLIPIICSISIAIIFVFILFYHIQSFFVTLLWLGIGVFIFLVYTWKKQPKEEVYSLGKYEGKGLDILPEAFFSTTLNNILVPMAGKKFEQDTIRTTMLLAKEFGAKITLFHIGSLTKEDFNLFTDELERNKVPYTLEIEHTTNSTHNSIVQNLVDISATGKYQLAVFSSRRRKNFIERWFRPSISYTAIEKIHLPALQVFQAKLKPKNGLKSFKRVASLLPGTKNDFLLLQIGRTIVSSYKGSKLWAYQFVEVPHLTVPRVVAESPDIQAENIEFTKHISEMIFTYGVHITPRFILGHDVIRDLVNVKKQDNVDLVILGEGKYQWGRRLSHRLVSQIDCTVLVFHGSIIYQNKKKKEGTS